VQSTQQAKSSANSLVHMHVLALKDSKFSGIPLAYSVSRRMYSLMQYGEARNWLTGYLQCWWPCTAVKVLVVLFPMAQHARHMSMPGISDLIGSECSH
jgi:hypothetical protein